jgi:cell division protein FtsB
MNRLVRGLKVLLVVPLCALVLAGAALLADSENGALALWDLRDQEREAQAALVALEAEADTLRGQVEALRSDPFEIERRAREQLGMSRKDERELRWR